MATETLRRSRPPDLEQVLEAVAGIHAANLEDGLRKVILRRLAPLFGTAEAVYMGVDKMAGRLAEAQVLGFDPAEFRAALLKAGLAGDFVYQATRNMARGTTFLSSQLLGAVRLRSSPLYRQLAMPANVHFLAGGVVDNGPERYTVLGFWRSRRSGEHPDYVSRLLALLIPQVRIAAEVDRRLDEVRESRHAGGELMRYMRHGVAVLDRLGRVLYLNPAALRLFADKDGITVRAQRLHAPAECVAVEQAIRAAIGHDGPGRATLVRLRRPSGLLPYELLVTPVSLATSRAILPPTAACMVMVSDPMRATRISVDGLVRAYALTPAEARLCAAILARGSVRDAADELQVSHNTARTHLKRIFVKLGVTSQVQLVQVLTAALGPHA